MPLYIKDDATAALVSRLAGALGMSKQAAVRRAVTAELERVAAPLPLRDVFAVLRSEHPLGCRTGDPADKEFFDSLSGERE